MMTIYSINLYLFLLNLSKLISYASLPACPTLNLNTGGRREIYARTTSCKTGNQPDGKPLVRCAELGVLHLLSDRPS